MNPSLEGKSREAGKGVHLPQSGWTSTLFPQLFSENPVIVIDLGDLSTPRSCSDFADRVMRHASTARDDVMGQSHQDSNGGEAADPV